MILTYECPMTYAREKHSCLEMNLQEDTQKEEFWPEQAKPHCHTYQRQKFGPKVLTSNACTCLMFVAKTDLHSNIKPPKFVVKQLVPYKPSCGKTSILATNHPNPNRPLSQQSLDIWHRPEASRFQRNSGITIHHSFITTGPWNQQLVNFWGSALVHHHMAKDPIHIHHIMNFLRMFCHRTGCFLHVDMLRKAAAPFSTKRENMTMDFFSTWGIDWKIAIDGNNHTKRQLEWAAHVNQVTTPAPSPEDVPSSTCIRRAGKMASHHPIIWPPRRFISLSNRALQSLALTTWRSASGKETASYATRTRGSKPFRTSNLQYTQKDLLANGSAKLLHPETIFLW